MLGETAWQQLAEATKLAESLLDDDDLFNGTACFCIVCKKEQNDKTTNEQSIEALPLFSTKYHPSTAEIFFLPCQHCGSYISLWYENAWMPVEDALSVPCVDPTTIRNVETVREYLAAVVLSQVLYNQRDLEGGEADGESPFLPPSPDDMLKLVVMKDTAVGFYSLIGRGTVLSVTSHTRYELDVLDTMYVRREFRHVGVATRLLDDAMATVQPGCLLGISEPISFGLLKVLWKYLQKKPDVRDRLWACSYTGGPGYRWNIYLGLLAGKVSASA